MFRLCHAELPRLASLLARAAVLRARHMCAPLYSSAPAIDLYALRASACPLLTLPTAYTGLTGRPHSPRAIADTATAIAGLTCSFPALLARLAFLPMRDPRTKRRYQELLRERELLFLLSGVANPRHLLTRKGTGRRGGSTEASALSSLASLSSVSFPEAPAPPRASFGPSRRPKLSLHQVMSCGTELSGSELSGTELSIEESVDSALEAPGLRAPEAEVHPA